MMYLDKQDKRILFQDIRTVPKTKIESNGSWFSVEPDVLGDFRSMKFMNNTFSVVIFDPPHLRCGKTSFMYYKYGTLDSRWKDTLTRGFGECFRVLRPNGVLIFKWCDSYKSIDEVLSLSPEKPVFIHKVVSRSRTKYSYFVVFVKNENRNIKA